MGLIAALLGFLGAIQVRSQAEVVRSLADHDNTALAFLIDDLHRSNEALAAEEQILASHSEALRLGGDVAADTELNAEIDRLRIAEGLIPVQGPGVTLNVQAPLTALDLQDAVNNLRLGGAEAIAINDQRVVTGTSISQSRGEIRIGDEAVRSPWRFQAIGDPIRLASAAEQMTNSMRSQSRVAVASYQSGNSIAITAVVRQHPLIYGR